MMDQTSTYSQSTLSFDSFLNTQIPRRSPLSQQEHRCLEQLYSTRKALCDILCRKARADV